MSNTEKWSDLWFSNLSPNAKLLFFYFVENCDNAGFFEVNKKFMLFHTGFNEQQLMEAGTELKKSYIKSKDGTKLWFKNFMKYQKRLPLNVANNSHKQLINLILENLSDENKFKGCELLNSLLPTELQIIKSSRKKKEVITNQNNNSINSESEEINSTDLDNINKRFVKPSVRDIYEYMVENDFEFAKRESLQFFSYYDSKDWKVGKNSMKNWKISVIGWINRVYDRENMTSEKISKLKALENSHKQFENIDWKEHYKNEQSNEQFN
jgi:hypothetical protein